jgi:NAD-dependent dihydropyrimidine dehydrogenase PreA subunit
MAQRITIDHAVCTSCLLCVRACPVDVIRADATGRPVAVYPDDCHVCFLCEDDCPVHCLVVDPRVPMHRRHSMYDAMPDERLRFQAT